MHPRPFASGRIGMALSACVVLFPAFAALCLRQSIRASFSKTATSQPHLHVSDDPRLVYSTNPADAWNRIFHSLFTRTVKTRFSDQFANGAPFAPLKDGMTRLRVSTNVFERFENGDRAIEPLYPSFFTNDGVLQVLSEPRFSELKSTLIEALAENTPRPPGARALMLSDAWAAYDVLFSRKLSSAGDNLRRNLLLTLFGRLIKKLALTTEEIQALPDNYALASSRHDLPNAFAPNSEWIEVQMSPHRLHDLTSDFRRSARVFLKPADSASDKGELLQTLRKGNFFPVIDSVALVIQDLLINTNGEVLPTHLTTEVQIRQFVKDQSGRVISTEIRQYELSRRSFLTAPSQGGLIEIDKEADLYLPASGNDYLFASLQFTRKRNDYPVLVSLRQRCEGCHGPGATAIFTFSSHEAPPLPPIILLPASADVHGWYVVGRKQEREDFKSLRR